MKTVVPWVFKSPSLLLLFLFPTSDLCKLGLSWGSTPARGPSSVRVPLCVGEDLEACCSPTHIVNGQGEEMTF